MHGSLLGVSGAEPPLAPQTDPDEANERTRYGAVTGVRQDEWEGVMVDDGGTCKGMECQKRVSRLGPLGLIS